MPRGMLSVKIKILFDFPFLSLFHYATFFAGMVSNFEYKVWFWDAGLEQFFPKFIIYNYLNLEFCH